MMCARAVIRPSAFLNTENVGAYEISSEHFYLLNDTVGNIIIITGVRINFINLKIL